MHGLNIGGDGDRAIEMEFGLELEETADTRGGCERPRRKETEDERDSFGGQGSLPQHGFARTSRWALGSHAAQWPAVGGAPITPFAEVTLQLESSADTLKVRSSVDCSLPIRLICVVAAG